MALFKYGGAKPNFRNWIRNGERFKYTAVTQQDTFIEQDLRRLESAWTGYDRHPPVLSFRLPVTAAIAGIKGDSKNPDRNTAYQLSFSFEDDAQSFFPITFQEFKIAVIPQNLPEALSHRLDESQAQTLLEDIDGTVRKRFFLRLEAVPVKGYLNAPQQLNGEDRWVLMANIVGASLEDRGGQSLWSYLADWYVSPAAQEVLDVYRPRGE